MAVALLTGGSRGLGRALAHGLSAEGWRLVLTGRDADSLERVAAELGHDGVRTVAGDVADAAHRARLREFVGPHLDLLVNNASTLGPTPRPRLVEASSAAIMRTLEVNVVAPVALVGLLAPALASTDGIVVNVTSDAAVEAWEGWGVYGSSKAALEHVSRVFAVEHPDLRVYAVDPGDLRTDMHQDAFPGEDISDRPLPQSVVPAFLELLRTRPPSGRHTLPSVVAEVDA